MGRQANALDAIMMLILLLEIVASYLPVSRQRLVRQQVSLSPGSNYELGIGLPRIQNFFYSSQFSEVFLEL